MTELHLALLALPPNERDAWVDRALGIRELPDDGPALPKGCVPYLPCPVDALLRIIDAAAIGPADVFVDVGSGIGRATSLVHLLTGARAIGIEVQPELVAAAKKLPGVTYLQGDAAELISRVADGTVFFLYCPFGGARLEAVLDALAAVARSRPIRVCCVDLPLPARSWLTLERTLEGGVNIYTSSSSPDFGTLS